MKFQILKKHIINILIGVLVGILITSLFYIINYTSSDYHNFDKSFQDFHKQNPLAWAIDSLPIIVAVLTSILGYIFQKKIKKLDTELKNELENAKHIQKHIEAIYKGNFEYTDAVQDQTLTKLQQSLKEQKENESKRILEDNQRHWTSNGHAEFSEILRANNKNIENLSSSVTSKLIEYLNIFQGGFYLLKSRETGQKYLELMSSYAFDRQKLDNKIIELGNGLVGACAEEEKTIYTKNIPENFINMASGLGNSSPSCLLIIPLMHNDELTGVIELANIKEFEDYEIEFLDALSKSIAVTIVNAQANIKTRELLEQSQQQSVNLAEKEEELSNSLLELRQAQEESLKQSEDFKHFTNAVNHTMISGEFSTDGVLLNTNTKFVHKLGFKDAKEIIGKDVFSFLDGIEKQNFKNIWNDLIQKGRHFEGDLKFRQNNGQDLWLTATFVGTTQANNSIKNILFLATDITERKQKSLDFSAQIEAINLASIKIEIQPNGDISEANNEFVKVLKYTPSEISKSNIKDFLSEKNQGSFDMSWSNLLKGTSYKGVLQFTDKDGNDKWLQGAASSIQDDNGATQKIIYIANDVTKQKLMEIEIQKSEEVLKHKLDLAKQELKEQFKEIEQEKVRSDLILEGMLDAIFKFDKNGQITFFNKAGEDLWNYSKNDVIGKNIKCLFSEETIASDTFVNALVDSSKDKTLGVRQEVNILSNAGYEDAVLMLVSEADIEGDKTYTAFVQTIEMELF
jgi:PAS domain S-box-containing protein